jgi:hypothetical protein
MIARISVEESACGECRCERPADHAVGAESAGADISELNQLNSIAMGKKTLVLIAQK